MQAAFGLAWRAPPISDRRVPNDPIEITPQSSLPTEVVTTRPNDD